MQQAAAGAVELDPDSAEARTALATWLWYYEREWAAAEAEFRRALELNPRYATAHA